MVHVMTRGTVVPAMTHGIVVHVTTQGKADGIVIHVMTHGTVGITHTWLWYMSYRWRSWERQMRFVAVWAAFFALALFYVIPITAVQSLINVSSHTCQPSSTCCCALLCPAVPFSHVWSSIMTSGKYRSCLRVSESTSTVNAFHLAPPPNLQ